ncbi:DUF6893 family small protein [Streptomyces sp. NPDC086787]
MRKNERHKYEKNESHMRKNVVLGVMSAAVAAIVVQSLPDLRRYLRMSRM